MQSKETTVSGYVNTLETERKTAIEQLRKVINKNLPKGFEECMNYGMIAYVVPHKIYPSGYHCKPEDPLPFACLASQKNNISFYHMGIYAVPELLNWFTAEYTNLNIGKPDMGKSCIRFKKLNIIPYKLIGELCSKITVQQWINYYEKNYKK